MTHRSTLAAAAVLASLALTHAGSALAQTATTAGTARLPEPTLHHLSIEWPISGDSDNDGVVAVRFRQRGTTPWRVGMPLRRVPAGSNASTGNSWTNRHAGSLFGLQPGTTYQVELTLTDPDGGNSQQIVSASTRPVPQPGTGTLRNATPATLNSVLNQSQPGDIVQLAAGSYAGFTLSRDGSAGNPLTLRGLPGAVISGELGLFSRRHVILQTLTVNGRIRFNGSDDISIIDSMINASPSQFNGDGIVCFTRCARAYIANNTVIGTTTWAQSSFGVSGNNRGEGIAVNGPGHVIIGNTVRGFRDGISFLEDSEADDQYSIDVLDNLISESADDGIEADSCFHNCRIIGNRLTNSFIAFSSQPSLGGPTYFIRNVAYNVVHVPFKLYRGSVGDVLLHNTIVKTGDGFNSYPGSGEFTIRRAYARNNLFLGGEPGTYAGFSSGSGRVVDIVDLQTSTSSFDYNGYGTTRSDFRGRLGGNSFTSLASLRSNTSEANGQQVDMAIFESAVAFPQNPLVQYAPVTLTLADDARAVDQGVVIPNINDDFNGTGPDLGAFERAAAVPPGRIYCDGFEETPCLSVP
ncbi:hypothetical protein [Pseudomarimonas salicorniae]|uniref:Right handed beta helix region n=1 Tax=Pseudomarimonas salicorniae TaxID=2933270 RepID=A0ABT0GDN5_9GAMM|nr:hypothetical protein [Lysobacter sp. CAU 1642]MCK7592457.1 hypothetical protein [Lysobacter sp. CAU 1642]